MTSSLRNENPASPAYRDLLDRARRRDADAFTRLYEATYRRVFSYLLARLGVQATAEDLLQEVYLAALRGLDRFRGRSEGEFIAWLFKIAHGKVVDHLRSQYRHPEVKRSDIQPNETINPLDAIDERLGLGEIAAALATLTEDQRDVVVNRFVLGFDLEETSHLMHKNVGSIKALQHRALARLAKTLRAVGDEHD
jgi:RNA polymerase sigma-70 factor (ECF subfamily)